MDYLACFFGMRSEEEKEKKTSKPLSTLISFCAKPSKAPKPQKHVKDHVIHHMTHVIVLDGNKTKKNKEKKKMKIKSPVLIYNKWEALTALSPSHKHHGNHVTHQVKQSCLHQSLCKTHDSTESSPLRGDTLQTTACSPHKTPTYHLRATNFCHPSQCLDHLDPLQTPSLHSPNHEYSSPFFNKSLHIHNNPSSSQQLQSQQQTSFHPYSPKKRVQTSGILKNQTSSLEMHGRTSSVRYRPQSTVKTSVEKHYSDQNLLHAMPDSPCKDVYCCCRDQMQLCPKYTSSYKCCQNENCSPSSNLYNPHNTIDKNIAKEVRDIRKMLKSFMLKLKEKDKIDLMAQEWRLVALVLDRLLFFIYLFIIVISMVATFPWKEASGIEETTIKQDDFEDLKDL